MNKKIKYFIDYYLVYIIVGIICALVITYFVKTICFDRKEIVLSVLILNDNEELNIDLFEEELKDYLGMTSPKQDITFSFLRTDIEQNQAIILTRLRARAVDIIISDEDTFMAYSQNGFYMELDEVVDADLLSRCHEKLEQGHIVALDENGATAEAGEYLNYGLNLGENSKYIQLGGSLKTPILGIAVNTMHCDNASKVIKYFWENK